MSEKIRRVLDHEEKVSSKGDETQFRRQDEKSEEIGRKYRIMKVLELEEASEMCQNLTTVYKTPNCSQSICRPSDPYRTIDGCCNNLDSPTLGILIEIQTNIPHPFLLP